MTVYTRATRCARVNAGGATWGKCISILRFDPSVLGRRGAARQSCETSAMAAALFDPLRGRQGDDPLEEASRWQRFRTSTTRRIALVSCEKTKWSTGAENPPPIPPARFGAMPSAAPTESLQRDPMELSLCRGLDAGAVSVQPGKRRPGPGPSPWVSIPGCLTGYFFASTTTTCVAPAPVRLRVWSSQTRWSMRAAAPPFS